MTVVVQLGLSLTNSPMYCKSSFFAFICWQLVFPPFCSLPIPVKQYQPVDNWVELDSAKEATGECVVWLPTGTRVDFNMDMDAVDERHISVTGMTMCIKMAETRRMEVDVCQLQQNGWGFPFLSSSQCDADTWHLTH